MSSISTVDSALQRAEEFISLEEHSSALQILYEYITTKRGKNYNTPIDKLEEIITKVVNLSVDLTKPKIIKDVMTLFRNIAVQVDFNKLKKVIKNLREKSEQKLKTSLQTIKEIEIEVEEDLEAEETPEELLISAIIDETDDILLNNKDSIDKKEKAVGLSPKELLTNSLKFLWDIYKIILELLNKNIKLEDEYNLTIKSITDFCKDHNRYSEFKKLCDILRNHLTFWRNNTYIEKLKEKDSQNQIEASVLLMMNTRLHILNASEKLGLWQEAFKITDELRLLFDIYKKVSTKQIDIKIKGK